MPKPREIVPKTLAAMWRDGDWERFEVALLSVRTTQYCSDLCLVEKRSKLMLSNSLSDLSQTNKISLLPTTKSKTWDEQATALLGSGHFDTFLSQGVLLHIVDGPNADSGGLVGVAGGGTTLRAR
jgi:hypothetical protein